MPEDKRNSSARAGKRTDKDPHNESYEDVAARRRLGETVRDVERREAAERGDMVLMRISLQIDPEDADATYNGEPVRLAQVAVSPEDDHLLVIQASNYPGSDEGAASVASLLETAARGIRKHLGDEPKPKRPRFNPQPRGGQQS